MKYLELSTLEFSVKRKVGIIRMPIYIQGKDGHIVSTKIEERVKGGRQTGPVHKMGIYS